MELIQNPNPNNYPTIEADREAFYKSLPPGFRFSPYDRELILFYLIPKIKGDVVPLNLIHQVNIYDHHPQQFAEKYAAQGARKWYFFTPRDKKYMNGGRPNRKAGDGYWKATGADKKIVDESEIIIGYKRSLVYYEGKPKKGNKTNWIMYEYVVKDNPSSTLLNNNTGMRLDNNVLCSIHNNDVNYNNYPQQQQQGGGVMFHNTTQSPPPPLALPPPPPLSLPPLLFSDFQLPPSLPPLPASDIQYGNTNNGDGHIWNNHSGTGNLLYSSMMNECTPSSSSSSSPSLLPPTNQNLQIMNSATDMLTDNGDEDVDWSQLDNLALPENWIQDTTCSELENFLKNLDY